MSYDLSDYVDVAERIKTAKEIYPELTLQSEWQIENVDGQIFIIFKAYAYRTPEDPRPAIGHAWEAYPARNSMLKGSEMMVSETSAFGRALVALGLETRKVASKDEMVASQNTRSQLPPSQREVKAPSQGEPVRGTDTVIKDPTSAPSEKQTMALVNKTTKVGISSDFFNQFWQFALAGGTLNGEDPITKGEASKLIGMDKSDFEGFGAAFFASLIEAPVEDAPF